MNFRLLVCVGILCVALGSLSAQEIDAKKMVQDADLLLRGETSAVQHIIFTVNRPGNKVVRKSMLYFGGRPFSFMHFLEPLRDRNITLLKRDLRDENITDVWMFSPQLRKKTRIPPANMHEGVLGSDYTYDDIINISTLADDYEPKIVGLSKEMAKEHGKVHIVDLTPLPGRPIAYPKLRLWIREQGTIILRQQYYNEQMNVTRVLVFSHIRELGGRTIPTKRTMVDLTQKGHYTEIEYLRAEFNSLTESRMSEIFSPRSLDTPPSPPWE